ncbi:hypothetical protein WA026_005185 [Henosepilachna vigintioctopunctata]|uniref:Uncharacterized protein n=1 Tax=Henosepilachna vigintioctopunctata TaxID=420089 RepID=A0AAW1UT77_9CUCU
MSKSKKCADKALGIIKKKTNKLAYTDYPKIPRGQCKPVYVPRISKPCGTRIRYCTAKELKLMSGSRICECTEQAFEMRKAFINTIMNALKAATIFGVTYITYDLGFWGVPKDTEATFANLCAAMPCEKDPCKSYEYLPETGECAQELELLKIPLEDPCKCDDPIPVDMEKCCYKMKQVWNHTVILLFDGIINAPDNIFEFLIRMWNQYMNPKRDCGVCKPMTGDEVYTSGGDTCELYDDYDEKYPEDECDGECDENSTSGEQKQEKPEEGFSCGR